MSFPLYRVYKTQNRPEEALSQCEKSLQLLKDCGQPEKTSSVYRDMAAIEHDKGHLERAIEHLSKVRGISLAHHTKILSNIYKHMMAPREGARLCSQVVFPHLLFGDIWSVLLHVGVSARLMPLLWVTVQRSWWGLKSPTAWPLSFLLQQSPIIMVSLFPDTDQAWAICMRG